MYPSFETNHHSKNTCLRFLQLLTINIVFVFLSFSWISWQYHLFLHFYNYFDFFSVSSSSWCACVFFFFFFFISHPTAVTMCRFLLSPFLCAPMLPCVWCLDWSMRKVWVCVRFEFVCVSDAVHCGLNCFLLEYCFFFFNLKCLTCSIMIFFYTNCLKIGLQGWWNLPLNSFHHLIQNQNLWKDWNFPYISFFSNFHMLSIAPPKFHHINAFLALKTKIMLWLGFFFLAKLHLISAYKKLWRKIQLFHSWNMFPHSLLWMNPSMFRSERAPTRRVDQKWTQQLFKKWPICWTRSVKEVRNYGSKF